MRRALPLFFVSAILVFQLVFWSSTFLNFASAQTAPQSNPGASTVSRDKFPEYSGVQNSVSDYLCTPEGNGTDLIRCVNRLYRFGLAFGGVSLVGMIVLAGYVYFFEGEKGKSQAKGIVSSSLIGIVILATSFIILRTINPQLTEFRTIQTPIFSAAALPTCAELGLGSDCLVGVGENSGSQASVSGGAVSEKGGVTYNGPAYKNFPRFVQNDSPWGSQDFGCNGTTIASSGCGPTAMAAVLKYYNAQGKISRSPRLDRYGSAIDPSVIGKITLDAGFRVCGSGTSHAMFATVAGWYGLKGKDVSWSEALQYLRQGYPVIASVTAGTPLGPKDGSHIIVFTGVDSQYVYISDPSRANRTRATLAAAQQARQFVVITP